MSDTQLATIADPLHQVFAWIVQGAAEHEIIEAIHKTFPDEEPRPLIVEAMKKISRNADADPDNVRGWCIAATQHVYQQAVASGNFAVALKAIRQLNDLAGK